MKSAALAFAIGVIYLQSQASLPASLPLLSMALLLGLAYFLPKRGQALSILRRSVLLLACLLFGLAWAGLRAEWRLADQLDVDWEGRDVEVVGVIAGLPQRFDRGVRFLFDIESSLTPGAGLPERVQLSWYRGKTPLPAVQPGQRWQLTLRLKRPHGGANPGGFDYEIWLLERGIRATGYVRPAPATLLEASVARPDTRLHALRAKVRERFRQAVPAQAYPWQGILTALAIGDQRAVESDLWTVFHRTGTVHLMVVSGLHVTLVAGLFGGLVALGWRRVPALALRYPAQRAALLAAALAAAAYAALSGFGVPAQRTLFMLLVAVAAMLSGRIVAPGRVLALALVLVLLLDPWSVLAAGFWLSFGTVAALLFVGSALVAPTSASWGERLRGWGRIQWAATLASLPILMLVFQQFPLVSPLANVVAIPVISFVVTPLALLAVVLPLPDLLMLAHWILDGLMAFLFWCAGWPLWQAPVAPIWAVLAAVCGVALLLLPRGVPGRLLGLPLLLPAVFWPASLPLTGEVWIDVLDVGQGQAVLVRTQKHALVFDPGPRYNADADAGQRVLIPFLRSAGVNHLDRVIVTHGDADHAGGLASLLAAVPHGGLISSMPELDGSLCEAGQHWQWDGVRFSLLHPAPGAIGAGAKRNSLSCVLAVESAGGRMLLTGDIEAREERAMIERDAAALRANILLVPHHGARGSSTLPFVEAVGAQEVIYSVGYRNRFGHPRPEISRRYADAGARQWRTDRDGAIRVNLGREGVEVEAWRQRRPRYWHIR